jgi:hypothetical protein
VLSFQPAFFAIYWHYVLTGNNKGFWLHEESTTRVGFGIEVHRENNPSILYNGI